MSKSVLVTGGTRGIGLGIARELARSHHHLAVNGVRDETEVAVVLKELQDLGAKVVYCRGDVSSAQDRDQIIQSAVAQLGPIHALVNNAGVAPETRVDLLETSEASFDRVMRINLKGPFFLSQQLARKMINWASADSGFSACIINISSVSAALASVERGEYCLSKAGVSMMNRLFAVRLGEQGIPVYEVRPGIIKTDMTAAVMDKYNKRIGEGLCLEPRLGNPEDVGKVVAALVEGKLPYATGQIINVDGGLTIPRL